MAINNICHSRPVADAKRFEGYSRNELQRRIEVITQAMKKQMPDLERALLNADRSDLRAALSALDAAS